MSTIETNLQQIRQNLVALSDAQSAVTLVAVSKKQTTEAILQAFAAGQRDFGENYVQEALPKIEALTAQRAQGLVWHHIGPLQSNKAGKVARHFDWVQGVDRFAIAEALSRHRQGFAALNVLIQVNISGEAQKQGVPPDETLTLARQIGALPNLRLRGVMGIIENTTDPTQQREQFRQLRLIYQQLMDHEIAVDTLSMGMSQDYPIALSEGSNMVRIGSALFGARK